MQSRQVYKQEELTEQELKAAKNSYPVKRKTTKGRVDRNGNPIEFRLTFEEWLSIWLASGKLLQRGIGQGQYCISRKDDLGHYEVANVFIQLATQNSREGKLGRPSSLKGRTSPMKGRKQTAETKKKMSEARR
ncbi:NUMOD3 domain-containing DNA-binding protein [Achromobacter mucicolens]|uniref:NUMOD3 domain-containing DNA-binding protein n=1 Tax=Achromobacter mucicolens TaxID=1389922 RepID=UPI00142E14A2|nr:NUMOD3 domain-containing DNA-binding protein [Achromobacter mucicolens]